MVTRKKNNLLSKNFKSTLQKNPTILLKKMISKEFKTLSNYADRKTSKAYDKSSFFKALKEETSKSSSSSSVSLNVLAKNKDTNEPVLTRIVGDNDISF